MSLPDGGDALTLAILAGVTFRKVATHNGPRYFYETPAGLREIIYMSANAPARSKQQAAEAWLARYEVQVNNAAV